MYMSLNYSKEIIYENVQEFFFKVSFVTCEMIVCLMKFFLQKIQNTTDLTQFGQILHQ